MKKLVIILFLIPSFCFAQMLGVEVKKTLNQRFGQGVYYITANHNSYDTNAVLEPTILKDSGRLKIYYTGTDTSNQTSICLITTDSIGGTKTKQGRVIGLGTVNARQANSSDIVKLSGTYYLYAPASYNSTSVYLYTSSDGYTFSDQGAILNISLIPNGQYWGNMAILKDTSGAPVQVAGKYQIIAEANNPTTFIYQLYLLECTTLNGTWTYNSTLTTLQVPGSAANTGTYSGGCYKYLDGVYYLFYHYSQTLSLPTYLAYATSTNTTTWTKHEVPFKAFEALPLGAVNAPSYNGGTSQIADPWVEQVGNKTYLIAEYFANNTSTVPKGVIYKWVFDGTFKELVTGLNDCFSCPGTYLQFVRDTIVFSTKTAVFMGNSITDGTGASVTANRFSSLLSAAKNATESNIGVGGITMYQTSQCSRGVLNFANIPTYSTQSVLILEMGTNDIGLNTPALTVAGYQSVVDSFVTVAIARGWTAQRIVLMTPPWCNDVGYALYNSVTGCGHVQADSVRHEAYAAAVITVANARRCVLADVFHAMQSSPVRNTYLYTDSLHPNNAGHAFIASYLQNLSYYKYPLSLQHLGFSLAIILFRRKRKRGEDIIEKGIALLCLYTTLFGFAVWFSSCNSKINPTWMNYATLDSLVKATPDSGTLDLNGDSILLSHTPFIYKDITIRNAFIKREDQITYILIGDANDSFLVVDTRNGLLDDDMFIVAVGQDASKCSALNTITKIKGDTIYTKTSLKGWKAGSHLYKNINFFNIQSKGHYTDLSCTFEDIIFDGNRDNNKGSYYWNFNSAILGVTKGMNTYRDCKFINSPNESIVGHNSYIDNCEFYNCNGSGFHTSIDKKAVEESKIHSVIINSTFQNTNQVSYYLTGHGGGAITHSNSGGYYMAMNNSFQNVGYSVLGQLYPSVSDFDYGTNDIMFARNTIHSKGTKMTGSVNLETLGVIRNVRIIENNIENIDSVDYTNELKRNPDIIIEQFKNIK